MTTGQFHPVKTRTLSDEVASQLREAIRSGAVSSGARLVEQEIAEQLGVSRVPVREAIQSLVEEGLLRKLPHRGAFVYLPTRSEIDEISSLRAVMEQFVVERVMGRWTAAYEATMRAIVDEMRQGLASGNMQIVFEQDYAFHRTLWEIADHAILLEIISSLRSRIGRMLYEATCSITLDLAAGHVAGHDYMIDLLSGQDVAAAKAEITIHIMRAKERIFTYCRLAD